MFVKIFDNSNLDKCKNLLKGIYEEEKNRSVFNVIRDINNNKFKGWLAFLYDNNEPISFAALEDSYKYTNEHDSLRFCRYYKLKSKRTFKYNLYNFFDEFINIAKENDYKLIYFTVFNTKVYRDIKSKKSNSIYEKYENGFSIKDFNLRNDILFYINKNCTQHIFEYKIDKNYSWNPKSKFIIPRKENAEELVETYYKESVRKGLV